MSKVGKGIINSVINKLPIELHLKNYRFCGPGKFSYNHYHHHSLLSTSPPTHI